MNPAYLPSLITFFAILAVFLVVWTSNHPQKKHVSEIQVKTPPTLKLYTQPTQREIKLQGLQREERIIVSHIAFLSALLQRHPLPSSPTVALLEKSMSRSIRDLERLNVEWEKVERVN